MLSILHRQTYAWNNRFIFIPFFCFQFFLQDNLTHHLPVYNISNETLFQPDGRPVALLEKNNFYLPVSILCEEYKDSTLSLYSNRVNSGI